MGRIRSRPLANGTAAALALGAAILFAAEATHAGGNEDFDGDGVANMDDNCSEDPNSPQDDTDSDFCGNYCDCDYNQDGICGVADFGLFGANFNTGSQLYCHVGPIPGCVVGVDDFGWFGARFNTVPGPSGTTPGTVACP